MWHTSDGLQWQKKADMGDMTSHWGAVMTKMTDVTTHAESQMLSSAHSLTGFLFLTLQYESMKVLGLNSVSLTHNMAKWTIIGHHWNVHSDFVSIKAIYIYILCDAEAVI